MVEGSKTQTLKQAGIDLSHVNRYEAIAAIPEEVFEEHVELISAISGAKIKVVVRRTASSHSTLWLLSYSPK
jgi:hypothetical protein